jgi:hypothetical protein
MDFLKEFISLHNQVCVGKKTQEEFNSFVIENKDKFDNPDYLQIFSERIDLFNKDYYKENFDVCKIFYDFMVNNPDWQKLDFWLRTFIRLGTFQDEFKDFLAEMN